MSKNVECVRVVVRCRPLSPTEIQDGRQMIVSIFPSRGEITIKNLKEDGGEGQKAYTFDSVFDWNSTQEGIYKETAFPIVDSVLEGYNGTIFAYGQTGTGKTHTMEGQPDPPDLRGIIPRAFEHIFKHIEGTPDKQFLVRASFLELYNEEIRDLLSTNPKNKLELREKPDVGVYVKDLSSFPVQNVEEMQGKLQLGRKNRVVGETKMNRDSSRSHSLFTITIEASEFDAGGENHIRMGKLNLVDLAGSERQSKTHATGDRFKEAISINQSLTTLGNVISALVDSKSSHVPYRDSKLTRLLQDSLGGNTKTVMVANIGPADWNFDETLSTLRYANRAKSIKNKPKINEDPKDAMLREFQEEIQRLKSQLEQFQGTGVSGAIVEGPGGKLVIEKIVKVDDEQKIKEMEEKLIQEKDEIKRRNEEERKKIEAQKNLAEEEKQKLLDDLKQKEEAEQNAKQNQEKLLKKLKKMEEKLLVGTKAMEQAVQQEKEYQKAKKELEEKKAQESKLAEELVKKEEENILMEKKFSSQQEEIEDKKKKLQKLYKKYQETNTELEDLGEEFNQERETYQEQLTELTKQLKLTNLMIDHFIPQEELNKIEFHSQWSEEHDDWIIPNPHLSGNSLRAKRPSSALGMKRNERQYEDQDIHPKVPSLGLPEEDEEAFTNEPEPNVYYVYKDDGIQREDNQTKEKPKRTASAKKSAQGIRKKVEIQPREVPAEDNFPKAKGLVKKSSKLN